MRGLKRQNFWITEGIMGAQGHDITGYLPRPNQAKMWSYQGVARGLKHLFTSDIVELLREQNNFVMG